MEDFRKKAAAKEPPSAAPLEGEPSYPASIEKMSEQWRAIRQQEQTGEKRGFVERNPVALGLGIGLLIVAFLIVIGGFALLVWFAR
jgi:hypothetical protein